MRQRVGELALRGSAWLLGGHPITLEYPPPAPAQRRWGWGNPSNAALRELFARRTDDYHRPIELIERHGPDLARVGGSDPGHGEPTWDQDWFTGLDAAALYAFIRARRPARYHEVGSGNSTLFAARAIRDGALPTRILSVDPHPRAAVDSVCDEMIRSPLEHADPGRVAALEAGDILLLDSSHYVLPGSDVVTFFLEVMPALPTRVLVGIHDVFLPDDYPWWLSGGWYSEQYMLAAWLLGAGEKATLVFPIHYCATESALRAALDTAWARAGLTGLAYGSTLWFET